MNIDVRVVDVAPQLRDNPDQAPHAMIKREVVEGHLRTPALTPAGTEPYEILQSQMDADEHQWSTDVGGSHVAIPLRPYSVQDHAENLVRFGLQFGAMAGALGQRRQASKIIFVMSTIFARPDHQSGYCVYAGVAVRK